MRAGAAAVQRFRAPARALATAVLASFAILLLVAAVRGHLPAGGSARTTPSPSRAGSAVRPSPLPASARAAVSSSLGAADPAYRIHVAGRSARAANPAQGLAVRLTPVGVRIVSRHLTMELLPRSYGYAGRPERAAAASLSAHLNRATYRRPGIEEWYVNGPLGLEQGLTVEHPSPERSGSVFTATFAVAHTPASSLSMRDGEVTLTAAGRGSIAYGSLRALDAAGRVLPSWLTLAAGEVALHVDTARARFPVTVDPLLSGEAGQVELRQAPSEAVKQEAFGTAVAISGDGNTALVSGPDSEGTTAAVWVFARDGASWVQQGSKLTAPPRRAGAPLGRCEPSVETCLFGQSLAISQDGDTAVIGDPPDGVGAGAAWIFTRSGTPAAWTASTELALPATKGGDGFGDSVALAPDGETALIGSPDSVHGVGTAWAFNREGSGWSGPLALEAPEAQNGEHFGQAIAISSDGTTAVVGAPDLNAGTGAAWIFSRVGVGAFHHTEKLTGEGESGHGGFGEAVAIAADGEVALIGAPADNELAGAAWVYAATEGTFLPQGPKLTVSGQKAEALGTSVALSADGSSALVGAPRERKGAGEAWLFTRGASGWAEDPTPVEDGPELNTGGRFGSSAALSGSGQTLLLGAPSDSEGAGAAWLFGFRPEVASVTPNKGPHNGGTHVTIAGLNFSGARAVLFGGVPSPSFEVLSPEAISAVSPLGEGQVNVTVETEGWQSAVDTSDHFSYAPPKKAPGGGKTKSEGSPPPPATTPSTTPTASPTGPLTGVIPTGHVLGTKTTAPPPCAVRLKSTAITVITKTRVEITLVASGSGHCAGRLTLRAQVRVGKRVRLRSLGTASYSLNAGRTVHLRVKLDSAGLSLLRSHHGRLKALLVIARTSPAPPRSTTTNVSLARASAHKR